MANEPKKFCCSAGACGPIVKTGFHFEQYYVCKSCKTEISEDLANRIMNNKQEGKPLETNVLDELYEWQIMFPDDDKK